MLIPTSGHQLILSSKPANQDFANTLFALDLETGEQIDLAPGGVSLIYTDVAPDNRTMFIGGANAALASSLQFVRAVDSGVVPLAAVTGFPDGHAGNHYFRAFSADERFAFVQHGQGTDYLEVIDTWKATYHAEITAIDGNDSVRVLPAPEGHRFVYAMGSNSDPETRGGGFGQLTDTGIELEEIPGILTGLMMSPDGSRIVYSSAEDEMAVIRYRDVPSGAAQVVMPQPIGDYQMAFMDYRFSLDIDHAMAAYGNAAAPSLCARIDLTTGEAVRVGEDGHETAICRAFGDGGAALAVYKDGSNYELAIEDVLGIAAQQPVAMVTTTHPMAVYVGSIGSQHATYGASDLGMTLVARDSGGEVMSAQVVEADEPGNICIPYEGPNPTERFAYTREDGTALVLVDHSEVLAQRSGTLAAQHGGMVMCPKWNKASSAFAYVERVVSEEALHCYIYVVHWPEGGEPSTPELVIDGPEDITVHIAQP
jgi:hypothetical protein